MRIKPRKGIRNVNKSFYVLFVFYFLMFYALPFSGLHLASHALSSTSLFSLSFFLCFSSDLLVSLFCFLLSSVPPIRSSLHSTHLHLFPIWFMSVLLFMFIFTPWQLLSITLFLFNHYFCWKNLIFLVSFHKCFLFRLYSIDSSFHFPFFIPVFSGFSVPLAISVIPRKWRQRRKCPTNNTDDRYIPPPWHRDSADPRGSFTFQG